MKKAKCEVCEGLNIVKQDGVFVCQDCGTQYAVEEMKKLLVEVGETVQMNTVKVDISDELRNLYQIARRAKDDENGENAARYYDMILVKDPTSWEASFYLVYFKAMECKIAHIGSAANSVENCISTVLQLIKDYVSDEKEQEEAVKEVAVRCQTISTMLYYGAKNHYDNIDVSIKNNYTQEMLNNCCAARDILYTLGNSIEKFFGERSELHMTAAQAWKDGIIKHNSLMSYFAQKELNKENILEYAAKVKKYDTSYIEPTVDTTTSAGGCYVATCVYGSYDCPQVWTLRRYRDNTLASTWYGRVFIHTYYAVSPSIVKCFGETTWFKKIWKGKLDRMVANLQANGVESTPYEDRNW